MERSFAGFQCKTCKAMMEVKPFKAVATELFDGPDCEVQLRCARGHVHPYKRDEIRRAKITLVEIVGKASKR
jgi:hypothetical protein